MCAAARGGSDAEVPLEGGDVTEGLVRVGATVRRPRQPSSASIAAYLRHLEAVGFTAAPRWHGVDDRQRDVLDYIEGDVPGSPPQAWSVTDAVLADLGPLLRRLHAASAGFIAPPDAVWFGDDLVIDLPPDAAVDEVPELITHCDVTPQNVVFRDGRPVAVIDFDLTRPTTRLLDVLNTAMHWVPLADPADRDDVYAHMDIPSRLRLFVDAYGLTTDERVRLLDLAPRVFRRTWHRMRANARHLGGGWARMWDEGVGDRILRRQEWLASSHDVLVRALR
jgi:Ser/Thr protein kinase RdoA (MazF antagonist)